MEILGIPLLYFILAEVVVFIGATVKGATGFGFALVSSPILVLMLDPKLVVAVSVPIQLAMDTLILSRVWRHVEPRKVIPIVLTGAIGVPLGNFVILVVSSDTLRLIVFSLVILFSIILITGFTVRINRERTAGGIAGLFAGVLYSSTSMSGPPMVLFMVNQGWSRETFRSSLSLVSVCLETLTVISLSASGVITAQSLKLDLVLIPTVLICFLLAMKLLTKLNPQRFRKFVTYLVFTTGVVGVITHFLR